METLVPLPAEELVTDFMATDGSDSARVITASATKESIEEYLAVLQTCGMVPDLLDVRGAPNLICCQSGWDRRSRPCAGHGFRIRLHEPLHTQTGGSHPYLVV